MFSFPSSALRAFLPVSIGFIALIPATRAAELQASDGMTGEYFGAAASLSGNLGIVAAPYSGGFLGSAYVFRNIDAAAGTVAQNVRLTASDVAVYDFFGVSVDVSGNTGIAGALTDNSRGSAYVFRNLDTATGTITQNLKLTASDGAAYDFFGNSVSLSGGIGLVGAQGDDDKGSYSGSAYVFRGLNTASGAMTQNVKLTASDGGAGDYFGFFVSLSGSTGLVGASGDDDKGPDAGAAYVFRNLDTATGSITQNLKLTASDGAANDSFGISVSLDGSIGIVGASYAQIGANPQQGSAYVFRNLNTASGSVTQNVKLTASDGADDDFFGLFVGISGNTAIVGANNANDYRGAAYVYRNLDTATGSVTESLKLTASDGGLDQYFGTSVTLDGDKFLVGAQAGNGVTEYSGKAYSGTISSMTTLNGGNTSRTIDGVSFISKEDWIIGQTTDANKVTLGQGDTATVGSAGKGVYIGKGAGSDDNRLVIEGNLIASLVHIGADGNRGNTLRLETSATIDAVSLIMGQANYLEIEGDFRNINALLTRLDDTTLQVWDGTSFKTVTLANHTGLLSSSYAGGYTTFSAVAVPESSTLLLGVVGAALTLRRRRCRG